MPDENTKQISFRFPVCNTFFSCPVLCTLSSPHLSPSQFVIPFSLWLCSSPLSSSSVFPAPTSCLWFPPLHNTIFFSQSLPPSLPWFAWQGTANHITCLSSPFSSQTLVFFPLLLIRSWPSSQLASLQYTGITFPKRKSPLMGGACLSWNTLVVLSKTLWQMTGV